VHVLGRAVRGVHEEQVDVLAAQRRVLAHARLPAHVSSVQHHLPGPAGAGHSDLRRAAKSAGQSHGPGPGGAGRPGGAHRWGDLAGAVAEVEQEHDGAGALLARPTFSPWRGARRLRVRKQAAQGGHGRRTWLASMSVTRTPSTTTALSRGSARTRLAGMPKSWTSSFAVMGLQ